MGDAHSRHLDTALQSWCNIFKITEEESKEGEVNAWAETVEADTATGVCPDAPKISIAPIKRSFMTTGHSLLLSLPLYWPFPSV
jgi:hypothetical protein